MPRILHLVPALFGERGVYGGAERYAFELARAMSEREPTTLAAFGRKDETFYEGRLRVRVIAGAWRVRGVEHNQVSARLLPEILRADVVHCHQRHLLQSTLCAALGRITRRKVFATDLGAGGWDIGNYIPTDSWFRAHLHISAYSRNVANHRPGVTSRVIYGGVDVEKFKPAEGTVREAAVLFVGRWLPHKGIDGLIEAMPDDVPLWIVGSEAHDRYVQDLKRLARGKRVEFLSGLDDAQIVERYRRAACCVLPSVYRTIYGAETRVPELLGQTLLESMACGTPAICTRVASMPEVVADGSTGFVVDAHRPELMREKLLSLVGDLPSADRMGKAGHQRVLDEFTWSRVVDRCLDAYSA